MRLDLTFFAKAAGAKTVSSLLLGFSVLLTAGCVQDSPAEPEVAGQVFIVLPDGNNLRLGSVEVRILNQVDTLSFLESVNSHISERRSQWQETKTELRDELTRLGQQRVAAEMTLRERQTEVRTATEELRQEMEETIAGLRRRIENNNLFIDNVDRMPEAPAGIPNREEFQAFEERKNKWLSMSRSERRSWGEALKEVNHRLLGRVAELEETFQEKVADWSMEIAGLEQRLERARANMAEAVEELENHRVSMAGFPSWDDFSDYLPQPVARARTDANGEFSLSFDRSGRYAVTASARRVVDGEASEYFWFFWQKVEPRTLTRLLLSNHNLNTMDFTDNISLMSLDGDQLWLEEDDPS